MVKSLIDIPIFHESLCAFVYESAFLITEDIKYQTNLMYNYRNQEYKVLFEYQILLNEILSLFNATIPPQVNII